MQLQKLDEVTSICSWSALWTDATKRKVDRCLQRLQTAGIKTGAKVSDVTLVDLSQKILSEREVIQRRWDLVQKFKRAKMTTEDCIVMSLHMDRVLPAQILTSFQPVDPTNDLASGFVQGFCEGAWMDLSFLRVIGKALQSDGANETLPKVVSLTMADIYLNQDKLGQRLRAHLRSRGAQDNGKTAVRVWAIFRRHFESCKRFITVKDDLEKLRGAALTLSKKLRASDAEVYNAVVDIFLEEGSEKSRRFSPRTRASQRQAGATKKPRSWPTSSRSLGLQQRIASRAPSELAKPWPSAWSAAATGANSHPWQKRTSTRRSTATTFWSSSRSRSSATCSIASTSRAWIPRTSRS